MIVYITQAQQHRSTPASNEVVDTTAVPPRSHESEGIAMRSPWPTTICRAGT